MEIVIIIMGKPSMQDYNMIKILQAFNLKYVVRNYII